MCSARPRRRRLNLAATDGDNCEANQLERTLTMKQDFQRTAALLLLVALAMASIGARAGDGPPLRDRYEVALDIDHDGRMDRAVLVRHPSGPSAGLLIFLAAGDEQLDPSRKPEIFKKDIVSGHVMRLTSNGRGSLMVQYGCGGVQQRH